MNVLQQRQLDIHGRLSASEYFVDVPVYLIRPRSQAEATLLQNKIDQAVAGTSMKDGKAGVACMVHMAEADSDQPDLPGPYLAILHTIRCVENPTINMSSIGTGKTAEDIGLQVLSELHLWAPEGPFNRYNKLKAEKKALQPVQDFIAQGKIAYDAILRSQEGVAEAVRVAAVAISGDHTAVTLSCATAGAAIYYTIDGSFPWSGNEAATLYAAPFAVAADTLVRANAFKTGLQGSDTAGQTIST